MGTGAYLVPEKHGSGFDPIPGWLMGWGFGFVFAMSPFLFTLMGRTERTAMAIYTAALLILAGLWLAFPGIR